MVKWKCDKCSMSRFRTLWDWLRTNGLLQWAFYGSQNTHYYINTIYFIHIDCGCVIQHCPTLNTFILKSSFSFVHHLRIISAWVFYRLCSFWSHLKGNWMFYNVVCITPFRLLGTFHLGLTHIIIVHTCSQWRSAYNVSHIWWQILQTHYGTKMNVSL